MSGIIAVPVIRPARIPRLAVKAIARQKPAQMARILACIAGLMALVLPVVAAGDPADIDAAARGVVRVVIVGADGEEIFPISHGTGFAVTRDRVVTNAHVVRDAIADRATRIGIVPTGGGQAVYGELVAVAANKDLALIRLTGPLRLPPLTLAGGMAPDAGDVVSVGYPMNVDRAQGLELGDIFRSQPPVKSRGSISGLRPSRQFDSILHTAPIARGNSGGPLLDECGRVLGVNSFGADNEGGDAEFFFAVSNRELIPFLRANGVEAPVSALPCRSMAELDASESARMAREQAQAQAELAAQDAANRTRRERATLEAQTAVAMEREDRLVLAVLLLLAAFALGQWALALRRDPGHDPQRFKLVAGAAIVCLLAALAAWLTRPGIDAIDRRVAAAMTPEGEAGPDDAGAAPGELALQCTLVPERSRVTGAPAQSVALAWNANGCVNSRTQYGVAGGSWSRVFVPNDEDAVAVNSFEPATRTYRSERFLLDRAAMDAARAARAEYTAPSCGAPDAAARLGEMQAEVLGLLPGQANERLVYDCTATR